MKLFAIVDNVGDEVIEVFKAKNINVADRFVKTAIQKAGRDIEVSLFELPINYDYDELNKRIVCFIEVNGEEIDISVTSKKNYPDTESISEEKLKSCISKDAKNECL